MLFFLSRKPALMVVVKRIFLGILLLVYLNSTTAQSCKTDIIIKLNNPSGGGYRGETLKLINKKTGVAYSVLSDENGEAEFSVPCNSSFSLSISNCSRIKEILTPDENGSILNEEYTYAADDLQSAKRMAMNDMEKKEVNMMAENLPDSIQIKGSIMQEPSRSNLYASFSLSLYDFDGKPLLDENIILAGTGRKKYLKCKTDQNGNLKLWLPKGDHYTINFKYHSSFSEFEVGYTRGISVINKSMEYIGTKEIERRKKIEADRIAKEEEKEKERERVLMEYCRKKGVSREDGIKLKALEELINHEPYKDSVISSVLNRNRWENKLIICDVTGSMSPYMPQLALWYQLKMNTEPNLQFVFFNDGDNRPEEEKVVGNRGGIYYSEAKKIEDLFRFMLDVSAKGKGGDLPENNIEALIKGTKMAKPFKELVMIADNDSPVWDIELLSSFKIPVHLIMCGVKDLIHEDYLNIALKTGGSIHTMKEDITAIARMIEGQEITINKITYRIMGGGFVRITKI